MLDYGLWIIPIVFTIIVCMLCFIAAKVAKAKLLRVFGKREAIPFEEWFKTYYSNQTVPKELVKEILIGIAKEIGIEATQIRPQDSFYREFRLTGPWRQFMIDEPVDLAIEILAEKYSKTKSKLWRRCYTVEDLINILNTP